jgi:SulP family sulfate permease
VVGGFIVSLLGGSRFQIGGPAGAFIVLVSLTAERHGLDGVILATLMAGVFLIVAGLLRLGTYIKFIPYPVTVGFTAGIAVIIFASQLRDLLGIRLAAKEPGELIPKLEALGHGLPTADVSAIAIAAVSIAIIVALRRLQPTWPGSLIVLGRGAHRQLWVLLAEASLSPSPQPVTGSDSPIRRLPRSCWRWGWRTRCSRSRAVPGSALPT